MTLTGRNAVLADDELARLQLAASQAVTGHKVDEIIHQHDTE